MFVCLLDCIVQCQLISDNAISYRADDASLSETETLSVSDSALSEDRSVRGSLDSLVAYGVGHFSTCPIARFQFALLLLLLDVLKVIVSHLQHHT